MVFRTPNMEIDVSGSDVGTESFFMQKPEEMNENESVTGGVIDPSLHRIEKPPKQLLDNATLDEVLERTQKDNPAHLPHKIDEIQLNILMDRGTYTLPDGEDRIELMTDMYETLNTWRQKIQGDIGASALENNQEK